MRRTRREWLRSLGTVSLGAVAGCGAFDGQQRDDPRTATDADERPTETRTEAPGPIPTLELHGTVRSAATADGPPTVEAALRNPSDRPVRVGMGPALLFSDNSGRLDRWDEAVAIVPEDDGVLVETPSERDGECWRLPEDEQPRIQSLLDWRDLAGGASISETYAVYTRGEDAECLPEGTYVFEDVISVRSGSNPATLALELSIGPDGDLTASGAYRRGPP